MLARRRRVTIGGAMDAYGVGPLQCARIMASTTAKGSAVDILWLARNGDARKADP